MKKRLLTSSDSNILQITRKIEQGDFAPDEPVEVATPDIASTSSPREEPQPVNGPETYHLKILKMR